MKHKNGNGREKKKKQQQKKKTDVQKYNEYPNTIKKNIIEILWMLLIMWAFLKTNR